MKTHVKKKTDCKATGNMPIKLVEWEKDFLNILHTETNPVYCKVHGSVTVGVSLNSASTSGLVESVEDEHGEGKPANSSVQIAEQTAIKRKLPKKRKLSAESDETAELSTPELQRLLLLEQIKLTRLKIKREEILLKKEQTAEENEVMAETDTDNHGTRKFFVL